MCLLLEYRFDAHAIASFVVQMSTFSDSTVILNKIVNMSMGSVKDIKAMAELWLWLDKVGLLALRLDTLI